MATAAEKRCSEDFPRGISADESPKAKVARLSELSRGEKEQTAEDSADEGTTDAPQPSAFCSTSVVDCIADVKARGHEATSRAQNSPHSESSLHDDAKGLGKPQTPLGRPKLTLRQRLANRTACGSPELTAGLQHDISSSPLRRQQDEQWEQLQQQQQQHRMLGGLSLQWRLTLLGGAQKTAKRKGTLQQEGQGSNSDSGAKDAPPVHAITRTDIGEAMQTCDASHGSVATVSEDVSTPPPSGRNSAAWSQSMSTPVPPSHDAKSHLTPRTDSVEGHVPPPPRFMENSLSAGDKTNACKSVKELKRMLEEQGINCDSCSCREDLEALWRLHMEISGCRAEENLPSLFTSNTTGKQQSVSEECKRYAALSESSPCSEKLGISPRKSATPPSKEIADGTNLSARKQVAENEISRLLGLHQDTFASRARWAFSVLRLPSSGAGTTIAAVQHAYRGLMRTVHPDRVGPLLGLSQAIEVLRKARVESERALEREVVPGQPRSLRAHMLHADAGLHRVKLEWEAPAMRREAPIRSYVIAAVDPTYGRALTVAKLEPDYSEELNRFVSIEELVSFVLAEKEMPKMSGLFRQPIATLQVAAANRAGQSPWSTVKVALRRPVTTQEAIG